MFEVVLYTTAKDEVPVIDFLEGLEPKMRAKASRDIEILENFGTTLRAPLSKPIRNGIFELRIQTAGKNARIFYFFYVNNKIILTNGFIKMTNKTPPEEIDKAFKYKADYELRQMAITNKIY